MKVFIGYDPGEDKAYQVAARSLLNYGLDNVALRADQLRAHGLYWRDIDQRGQPYDLPSNAPCSTEFATTRFLTPILGQSGWALFVDCDVIFLDDPRLMLDEMTDADKAVYVVQHHQAGGGEKMVGLVQTSYPRKNWSSVMLFNCDHPGNRRLSIQDINRRPGRDLHSFYWLADNEVGALDVRWNWLVNCQDRPPNVGIAHYTNGGPWLAGWTRSPFDELWLHHASKRTY